MKDSRDAKTLEPKAKAAFNDYITFCYASPNTSPSARLLREYAAARRWKLSVEEKVYLSVLINEFHLPPVSRAEDARKNY